VNVGIKLLDIETQEITRKGMRADLVEHSGLSLHKVAN